MSTVLDVLTYTGPWGPLIALGIVFVGFPIVIGGILLAQGPIMDFKLWRWRRSRTRATRRDALPRTRPRELAAVHQLTRGA